MSRRDVKRFRIKMAVVGLIILGLGLWLMSMGLKVENGETIIKNWMGPVGFVMFLIGLFVALLPYIGT